MPTLDEYRNNPGEFSQDAADIETEVVEQEETFDEVEADDTLEGTENDDTESDDTELPPQQENAFTKRLERERRKLEEQLRQQVEQEYEQKYGKHKQVVDMLGGDPEAIEKNIRDNQLRMQAQTIAEQNGWDEDQTRWFMEQQKRDQELQDMRVQLQINDLKDNPEYAGIAGMKQQIIGMIQRSGNALTAEQAYWALGGKSRAEQIKREAQQREIAKRSQPKRTVQSDSPTSTAGPKPLPPEIEAQRKKLGLSETEARALLSDGPSNLAEYRSQKGRK